MRNGEKIYLTDAELHEAYCEKQHLYDMENIRDNIPSGLEEDAQKKLAKYDAFLQEAAYIFRTNMDQGYEYEYALQDAIKTAMKEFS